MGRKKKEKTVAQEPQTPATNEAETKPLKLKRPEGDIADGAALLEPDEKGEYSRNLAKEIEFVAEDSEDFQAEISVAELENGKWISAARSKSDSMGVVFVEEALIAKEQHDCEAFAVIAALHRLTLALEPHKEDEAIKKAIGEIGAAALDWKMKADAFALTQPQAANPADQKPEEAPKSEPVAALGRRETRTLPCKFTDEEFRERTKSLCKLVAERDETEEEKKASNASFTEHIKGLDSRISQESKILDAGNVDKNVECVWKMNDPKDGMKTLYRTDTGIGIETIPMDLLDMPQEQEPAAEEPAKAETVAEEPKPTHPGDNGDTFISEEGASFPCEQFDANRDPKEYAQSKGHIVEFSEADAIAKIRLPQSAAIAAIARVPGEQGAPATYRLRVFADAKERVEQAKKDMDAAAKLESAKVDVQPETKPEAQPEAVADPVVAEAATTQPAKSSSLTDEDKARGAVWCLSKYGIAMSEAEGAMKRNGKLPLTQELHNNPKAMQFVLDNIEQVEKWVLDIRKEEKARKDANTRKDSAA